MSTLAKLAAFLQDTNWPQVPEQRPTFFSIAKFPHYENVMSNVYQFFFNTESPHGLGSLCLDALLEATSEAKKRNGQLWQQPILRRASVKRELLTNNGRLDLLIHDGNEENEWQSATSTILIENKINYWLANDLGDYWNFVTAENTTFNKTGIVLCLKSEPIPAEWQSSWVIVTHIEWARAVERRLGPLVYKAEPRYLTLLLELIENIRTMTNANENFGQMLTLFQENREAISRAEQIRNDLFYQVPAVIREVIPPKYIVEAGQKGHGWLTIYGTGIQPLKYILGYYEIFHGDGVTANYRITLMVNNDTKAVTDWYSELFSMEVEKRNLQKSVEPGGILEKVYQLSSADYQRFPQLVMDNLRNDWELLEPQWLDRIALDTK